MKRTIGLIVVGLLLVGCRGKDGEPGRSFSSSIVNRDGTVTSDEFTVNIPGLSIDRGDILAVYVCLNTACVQMEVFQPGSGINVFYVVQGANVTLFNAQSSGSNIWHISALEKI